MTTVKSLYEDSLYYEESTLAHYIMHLLQEGKAELDDDISKLKFEEADQEKVREMIRSNQLGFSKIKVFALKYSKRAFAFVFAKSEDEATEYFKQTFKKKVLSCYELSLDTPMARGNRILNFREMRKEHNEFPVLAGTYVKG